MYLHSRSYFGIASGASGGAFTSIAQQLLPEFPSLELHLLGFLSALAMSFDQAKGCCPLELGEDTVVLDLEQNFGLHLGDEAVVISPKDCQVPQLSLVVPWIWLQIPCTDFSELELASCGAMVSGYMDCLQSTESSATYLSTHRLMTTHDFDPCPLHEPICTSMQHRP